MAISIIKIVATISRPPRFASTIESCLLLSYSRRSTNASTTSRNFSAGGPRRISRPNLNYVSRHFFLASRVFFNFRAPSPVVGKPVTSTSVASRVVSGVVRLGSGLAAAATVAATSSTSWSAALADVESTVEELPLFSTHCCSRRFVESSHLRRHS